MPLTVAMPDAPPFPVIRGLDDYWASRTFRAAPQSAPHDRILLDMLGLGLEQTTQYLARTRPDLAQFHAWIVATAGSPDPLAVVRYHACMDGLLPPTETQTWLDAITAAPNVLDRTDLARWQDEGYTILRNAIPPDEAKAAESLLWRTIGGDPADPDSWYSARGNGIMIQHFQDPALDVARRSPRIHKAFAQLWNTADLWMTTDRMSFNPPERDGAAFQGPHLHWDVSLARPIPFATQGILYLTDTDANQGALRIVPGFHHRIDAWLDGPGARDPRGVNLDAEAIPIAADRGDLIIWRQDLPHRASPNSANRPRMAQYINMYPADRPVHPVWL